MGQRMGPDDYYRAWLTKNDFWQAIRPTFEQFDLLVTPTVACLPFAIGQETARQIAGRDVSFYGWAPFSAPFNMTGQPAISIPVARSEGGLPIGLQIVGRRFADNTVLSVAAAYERAYPWPALSHLDA
jgi:Asp-tRNA(Asn)/Glu-tRNA(Gln) amidotransferase A subunit family amidase